MPCVVPVTTAIFLTVMLEAMMIRIRHASPAPQRAAARDLPVRHVDHAWAQQPDAAEFWRAFWPAPHAPADSRYHERVSAAPHLDQRRWWRVGSGPSCYEYRTHGVR